MHPKPPANDRLQKTVLIASPRGFCAGVDRAIQIVERTIEKYGAPVFVRHEIVHNQQVVARLESLGAVFVEELDECPADRPVVFSAHGVPKSVPAAAQARNMNFLDATCPLVSKVHIEAQKHHKKRSSYPIDRSLRAPRGRRHDGAITGRGHDPD